MSTFEGYSNYKVIGPGMGNFSTSELKLTATTMSFNAAAAAELGYPEVVIMMASPDAKYLLVQVYDEAEAKEFNFLPIQFYDRETRPKRVTIRDKHSVQTLRAERQWFDKVIWRIPGIKLGSNALMFDLTKAFSGKGKAGKKSLSLQNYPTLSEIKKTYKAILALPAASYVLGG